MRRTRQVKGVIDEQRVKLLFAGTVARRRLLALQSSRWHRTRQFARLLGFG